MGFMFDECLKIAYTKSDEFISELNYEEDSMIGTNEIVEKAAKKLGITIEVSFVPFLSAGVKENYGAMMRIELKEDEQTPKYAHILINTDKPDKFQRFSIVHELGHLLTSAWDKNGDFYHKNDSAFVVSTHIDYDVTNISKEEYEKNTYLRNEQIANIFALRVLMPSDYFYQRMNLCENVAEVATFFGVDKGAVISRARVGD